MVCNFGTSSSLLSYPINDTSDTFITKYSQENWTLRCKLASLYRILNFYNFDQSIYNHITLKITENLFLINPFGLMYNEITASSLVTFNIEGDIVDSGSTGLGLNKVGMVIHSSFHKLIPSADCVLHIHHPAIVSVSNMKCGLLPISQEAMIVGAVSYYDYNGIEVEGTAIEMAKQLNPAHRLLILKNHGVICIGSTVEEVFYWIYNLVKACEIQIMCVNGDSSKLGNLVIPSQEVVNKVQNISRFGYTKVNYTLNQDHWDFGCLEYEAHMRILESLGCDTGYPFKNSYLVTKYQLLRENSKKDAGSLTNDMLYISRSSNGVSLTHIHDPDTIENPDSGYHHLIELDENYDKNISGLNGSLLIDSDGIYTSYGDIPKSESNREIRLNFRTFINSHSNSETDSDCNSQFPQPGNLRKIYPICRWVRSRSFTSGVSRAMFKKNSGKIVLA